MKEKDRPFDLEAIRINLTDPSLVPAQAGGRRVRKPRYFVKVPWEWVVQLKGAPGQTWNLAVNLLFLHWKSRGASITLSNRTLELDGIPAESKRRALRDLSRRGLVRVDWRPQRSPIVRVLAPLEHHRRRLLDHHGWCRSAPWAVIRSYVSVLSYCLYKKYSETGRP